MLVAVKVPVVTSPSTLTVFDFIIKLPSTTDNKTLPVPVEPNVKELVANFSKSPLGFCIVKPPSGAVEIKVPPRSIV